MEAPLSRAALSATATLLLVTLLPSQPASAAGYRTANFTVAAPTPALAQEIGDKAEYWRRELAREWLGRELPAWSRPCPIKAYVRPGLGAGGETSFVFDRGQVFDWDMRIQGSRERILDSVLPHEVTHTLFACHFRRPLPRWADEGACTTVEHVSEISKQERLLIEFLRSRQGIPFSSMFAMKDYPQNVLPLYAQGHSLTKFLIQQWGKRQFLAFLEDGLQDENWPRAVSAHYGYANLLTLQNAWMDWIRSGRPELQLVASAAASQPAGAENGVASNAVIRGQDPGARTRPTTPRPVTAGNTWAAPTNRLSSAPSVRTPATGPSGATGTAAGRQPPQPPSVYDQAAELGPGLDRGTAARAFGTKVITK